MKRKMISKIITVTVVILTIASTKINLVSTQEIKGAEEMGNQNQVSDIKTNSVTTKTDSVSQVNTTSQNATDLTHAKVETQMTEIKTKNSTLAESVIADNAVHQAQPSAEPPIVSSSSSTESKTQTTEMKTNNSTLAEGGIVDNAVHQAQPSAEQPIVSSSSSTESKTQTTETKTKNSTVAEGHAEGNAIVQTKQANEHTTNSSPVTQETIGKEKTATEDAAVVPGGGTAVLSNGTLNSVNDLNVQRMPLANSQHQELPFSPQQKSLSHTNRDIDLALRIAPSDPTDNGSKSSSGTAEIPPQSTGGTTFKPPSPSETPVEFSSSGFKPPQPEIAKPVLPAENLVSVSEVVQSPVARTGASNGQAHNPIESSLGASEIPRQSTGGTTFKPPRSSETPVEFSSSRFEPSQPETAKLLPAADLVPVSKVDMQPPVAGKDASNGQAYNGVKSLLDVSEIPRPSTGGTTFKPPRPSETPVEFSSSGFKPSQPETAKLLPAEDLVTVREVVQSPVARTDASNGQAYNGVKSALDASEIPRQSTGGTTFKPPRPSEPPVEFSSSGFKPPQPETAKLLPKEYLVSVSEVVEYPVARKGASNGEAHNPIKSSLDASEILRQSTGGTTFKPPRPSEPPVEFSSSGFKPPQPETAKLLPKEYLISVSEVVEYPVARKAASNGQADNGIESSSSGSALPQYNIMQYPKFNQDSTTNVGLEPPVAVTSVPKRESAKKSSSGGPGIGQYEILGYVKIDENFDSPHQPATQLPTVDRRPPEVNTNNRRRFLPNGCRIPNYEMVGCIKSSEVP